MNWLPSWGAWQFVAAGAAGAATTILIHLLNRRRHQVLHWAAMEFLQQAVRRKRRVLQLRDTVLLALRALAILLFGLALARPHYSASDTTAGPQPIHAVIAIDNSLSMSYRTLDGTLLARAKSEATALVQRLPSNSRFTIMATCGNQAHQTREPFDDASLAVGAIEQIAITDAVTRIDDVVVAAQDAAQFETNLARVLILFSDQQKATWDSVATTPEVERLDSIQMVDVSPARPDNTHIASVAVQDGFVESRVPAAIRVTVRRSGGQALRHAEIALLVNEQLVGARNVTLQPQDQSISVEFEHSFRSNASRAVDYIPMKAIVSGDRLIADDVRHLIVPVFSRLPIVFIDQLGASEEDERRGLIGETKTMRRLLHGDRDENVRDMEQGQFHITIDELDSRALDGARMVVLAGVKAPGDKVAMLRRFVE